MCRLEMEFNGKSAKRSETERGGDTSPGEIYNCIVTSVFYINCFQDSCSLEILSTDTLTGTHNC